MGRILKEFQWLGYGLMIGLILGGVSCLFWYYHNTPNLFSKAGGFFRITRSKPSSNSPEAFVPDPELTAIYQQLQSELQLLLLDYVKKDMLHEPVPDSYRWTDRLHLIAQTEEEKQNATHWERQWDQIRYYVRSLREKHGAEQLRTLQRQLEQQKENHKISTDEWLNFLKEQQQQLQELMNSEITNSELRTETEAFSDELKKLRKKLLDEKKLRDSLVRYDQIFDDTAKSSQFLQDIIRTFPDTPYSRDFLQVSESVQWFQAIDLWNRFILADGSQLDSFFIDASYATATLNFIEDHQSQLAFMPEWKSLTGRVSELVFAAKTVPIEQKISKLLENAGRQDYYCYCPTPNQWYYLPDKPQQGLNHYVADLFGSKKNVILPDPDAVSTGQSEFFRQLAQEAETQLSDQIRRDDVCLWYKNAAQLLCKLQENREIDPLLQYLLLKDICAVFSEGDYYFNQQLVPWKRVLDNPKFERQVNWYDAEVPRTQELRVLARHLVGFLPRNILTVNKTTAELNQMIDPVAFVYHRVGWMDQDLLGNWYCRPGQEKSELEGNLMVLRCGNSTMPEWIQIGSMKNGTPQIRIASTDIRRGMVVYCRSYSNPRRLLDTARTPTHPLEHYFHR